MEASAPSSSAGGNELPEDRRYNPRKMFVGGLGPHITARSLIDYFSKYGEVSDSSIVLDRVTGRSRGFGFVVFKDIKSVDKCGQKLRHIIENVNCEVRKAVPREDARQQTEMGAKCKVFVSGLSEATRENHLREYFEAFGPVEEANIKTDRLTGRSRGFAFVLFKTPESARQSLGPHPELGPTVEAKIAEPRSAEGGSGAKSRPNLPLQIAAPLPPPPQSAAASKTNWPAYNTYTPYPHLATDPPPTNGYFPKETTLMPPPPARVLPAAPQSMTTTPSSSFEVAESRPWFEPSLAQPRYSLSDSPLPPPPLRGGGGGPPPSQTAAAVSSYEMCTTTSAAIKTESTYSSEPYSGGDLCRGGVRGEWSSGGAAADWPSNGAVRYFASSLQMPPPPPPPPPTAWLGQEDRRSAAVEPPAVAGVQRSRYTQMHKFSPY